MTINSANRLCFGRTDFRDLNMVPSSSESKSHLNVGHIDREVVESIASGIERDFKNKITLAVYPAAVSIFGESKDLENQAADRFERSLKQAKGTFTRHNNVPSMIPPGIMTETSWTERLDDVLRALNLDPVFKKFFPFGKKAATSEAACT